MDILSCGELIRSYRIERGMTQEILAKGICSPSELSKIETGSRNPTRDMFIALMNAMGVNGYSFFTLYANDSELIGLKRQIREAADFGDEDRIFECLQLFQNKMKLSFLEDAVYYNYALQLYYRMRGHRGHSLGKISLDYLEAIHPGLLENMGILTYGLTRQERVLVNGAGLGFMDEGEYDTALAFFRFLYVSIRDSSDELFEINRTRAVALNNMAIALIGKSEYKYAEEVCVNAFHNAYSCGDLLRAGILRTYITILEKTNQLEKAMRFSEYIRFQNSINEYMRSKPSGSGVYGQSDGMILI